MSCQQLGDECKLCIFCAPGSEILLQICLSPSSPPPYSVKCWQKWKGLGKVIYTLIHWTAMLLYQLQMYKVQVTYSSQIVGIVYPIQIYISKMYIHQPCARRAHRNRPTYIHPPSVGMIYPLSTYIFKRHM